MFDQKFYGSASIGEKGQIVIPVDARNELNLQVGDKLLVVSGPGGHGLVLLKPDMVKEFAKKMNDNFVKMQNFASISDSESEVK